MVLGLCGPCDEALQTVVVSIIHCVFKCGAVLQCVTVCCSVFVAVLRVLQCDAVCCNVMLCVAVTVLCERDTLSEAVVSLRIVVTFVT